MLLQYLVIVRPLETLFSYVVTQSTPKFLATHLVVVLIMKATRIEE